MAVTGPGSHIQASRCADPCRVADVTHQVTDDPWTEAASPGLIGFPPALEIP